MSPLLDRNKAKESGFAQVRAAIIAMEGDVDSATFDQWAGGRDKDGKPIAPREFLEIKLSNVHILEASELLSMDIEGKEHNFRINCSDSKGSFWVEEFLRSADELKLIIPESIVGKRVQFKKVTRIAKNTKFNSTGYVITSVRDITKTTAPVGTPVPTQQPVAPPPAVDAMAIAEELAVGKTEAQFRTAISLDPRLAGNSILSLAKAGAVTSALVKEGKLKEVKSGGKTLYARP